MKKNKSVFFVSSGLIQAKKNDNKLSRAQLYPNYGLIGLASILKQKGYGVRVFHGGFIDPKELISFLVDQGILETLYPIFLSLPSSFAITWAQLFCSMLKVIMPRAKIVVGGKWVVGVDGPWIKSKIPEIDLVVYGNAELRLESLLSVKDWPDISFTDISKNLNPEPICENLQFINFGLVQNYKKYQPSIVLSRGCGLGCGFCLEKDVPLGEMQSPYKVVQHLQLNEGLYGGGCITPYFQASFFRPTYDWIAEFANIYKSEGVSINWRAETRVDSITPKKLAMMAEAGLKVLDLGLESASPAQIIAMEKSSRPDTYLKKASALLKECQASGVWAKVNIMLYAGENDKTLDESLTWLTLHNESIKGVSVNPLLVYRFGEKYTEQFVEKIENLGASLLNKQSLEDAGFSRLNLSRTISYDRAEKIALSIRRQFMTANDYYDLKKFSYFPRDFSKEKYIKLIKSIKKSDLPFADNVF